MTASVGSPCRPPVLRMGPHRSWRGWPSCSFTAARVRAGHPRARSELDNGDVAYLAPQAGGNSWYPYSFLAPTSRNEPGISSAMGVVAGLLDTLAAEGKRPDQVVVLGFSQGACLALEFAARNPARYAAIVGLSGGLIGPSGTPRNYPGSMKGTPVFLGCSDVDAHIPVERVIESAEVFRRMGAAVDEPLSGMGHTVNDTSWRRCARFSGPPGGNATAVRQSTAAATTSGDVS